MSDRPNSSRCSSASATTPCSARADSRALMKPGLAKDTVKSGSSANSLTNASAKAAGVIPA
jgi:hypothetical protein